MEWQRVWILRGPNVWARCPLLEVEVELGGLRGLGPEQIPDFVDRIHAWMPGAGILPLPESADSPDFLLARSLQQLTLELQRLAGSPVGVGLVRETNRERVFRVLIEFEEEELALACLESGRRLCLAALTGEPIDVQIELSQLRDLAHEVRLGPSTAAIVRAARQRDIPVRRLSNHSSLVLMGHGARQRRICTAETDRTSALAEAVAQDKQLTRALLQAVGVPAPEGRPVEDADDAWQAAEEIGPPVVVKPQYGWDPLESTCRHASLSIL